MLHGGGPWGSMKRFCCRILIWVIPTVAILSLFMNTQFMYYKSVIAIHLVSLRSISQTEYVFC